MLMDLQNTTACRASRLSAIALETGPRRCVRQSGRDHQVQYQPIVRFEFDCNTFADAAQFGNTMTHDVFQWRVITTNEEWIADPDVIERLIANSLVELLDVDVDVRKFWHLDAGVNSNGAADTGSTQAAIARRIFCQVLLVVILGVPEFVERLDVRCYCAEAGSIEFFLV